MEITQAEVQKYYDLTKKISDLEKEKKALNEKFKKVLGSTKSNYTIGDLEVKVIPQDKSKVDEPLALSFVKGKKTDYITKLIEEGHSLEEALTEANELFDPCIVLEEHLIESSVENLVYKGYIVPEEFQEQCVIHQTVVTLRVDPIKKEATDGKE